MRMYIEWMYSSTYSESLNWMHMNTQLQASATIYQGGNCPLYALYMRLYGPQSRRDPSGTEPHFLVFFSPQLVSTSIDLCCLIFSK
jgi:hypothetical protein